MTTNQDRLNSDCKIQFMQNERFIIIDGKRFHYTWLRDHCPSPKSRHQTSFQRLYDISDSVLPPKPLSVEERDGQLIIDWDENPPHRSIFSISWLLRHAYDPKPACFSNEIVFWDKLWLEANSPDRPDTQSCNSQLWINQLFKLGFVILQNIAPENLDSFISSIGPIRNTEYGKISSVKVTPEAKDLFATAHGLPPHTDFTFWQGNRVAQFLYCVENNALGGDSMVVDGFRVANDFRQDHPDHFQTLVKTPVQFWLYNDKLKYFFCPENPIIELDHEGRVAALRFHYKNYILNLPFEQMESFYEAYSRFFNYLKNPDYQYCFRLKPGECLLVQNFRVLHGRTAFDPTSGSREIKTAYMEWDYLIGRRNFEQREFYFAE
ncbi:MULTISPECIES: TauD/TfdA family dioxygenase [Okeania]|uniref:DUF971 domain-containing protein n=2 Tax=Microcoleaceae TaxID=1892252 RepID=A0A3N6P5C1_9CYAN|nr:MULTISPECIES: TauD/TfdA family dioxygenase [Okeania]NES79847.1 DUF971 domain-containing protein [Okeania sp. SIO1H4]NES91250.1 DUF971 domain-containing protein [Okeania sp. SIO2B9]NET23539.1 DUF971 domain-containing protein [Okeania sp. SIO1H5]NET80236.1 DUF971 domain-containing protein [Okeania sp. SIO1F9]NET97358.1 DUF971 domain-containing protein [Okeania sp. SIO1H2]